MRRERSVERARGETFELSVETERFFQKRGVTNALVPRRFSGKIVLTSARRVFQEARAHKRTKRLRANNDRGIHKIDSGNLFLTFSTHVIGNDIALLKSKLVNDGCYVIGPFVAIGILIGLGRRIRHSVAAKIESNDTGVVCQRTSVLFRPTQMAL